MPTRSPSEIAITKIEGGKAVKRQQAPSQKPADAAVDPDRQIDIHDQVSKGSNVLGMRGCIQTNYIPDVSDPSYLLRVTKVFACLHGCAVPTSRNTLSTSYVGT